MRFRLAFAVIILFTSFAAADTCYVDNATLLWEYQAAGWTAGPITIPGTSSINCDSLTRLNQALRDAGYQPVQQGAPVPAVVPQASTPAVAPPKDVVHILNSVIVKPVVTGAKKIAGKSDQ